MEANAGADLRASMQAWDQGAWCLAAVALAGRPDSDPATRAAADELLVALGVKEHPDAPFRDFGSATVEQVAGQASAPLLQVAALLGDRRFAWMEQSDDALLAQGAASAQAAPAFAQFLLPVLEGLAERLASPGVRMLDVGTGVGALAVAYAEAFPALSVTGVDVMERVLALAERTAAGSSVGDRVSFRRQSVTDLDEEDRYDLAWLPAPFVPRAALTAGMTRVARAMRPGGWMVLGHGKFSGDAVADSLTRLKTTAYGGTPLDDAAAQELARDAGFVDVSTMPTPPGAPAITVGRSPPR